MPPHLRKRHCRRWAKRVFGVGKIALDYFAGSIGRMVAGKRIWSGFIDLYGRNGTKPDQTSLPDRARSALPPGCPKRFTVPGRSFVLWTLRSLLLTKPRLVRGFFVSLGPVVWSLRCAVLCRLGGL